MVRHYVVNPVWAAKNQPWIGLRVVDTPYGLLRVFLEKFVPHQPLWTRRRFGRRVRLYVPIKIAPPPPPTEFLWRYSLAFNFIPIHGLYYGALCQIWRVEKDKETEFIARDNLIGFLQEFIGYPEEEFWFEIVTAIGSGWQQVPYEDDLIDFKRMVIEDANGEEIDSKEEQL